MSGSKRSVACRPIGAEPEGFRGSNAFGVAEKEMSIMAECFEKARPEAGLRHEIELDHHVPTEDNIKASPHRPGCKQVELVEVDEVLQFGFCGEHRLLPASIPIEIGLPQSFRDAIHQPRSIAAASGKADDLWVDIRG